MSARTEHPTPLRLLIVLPSWVGDAVMATPALRLIRDRLRGSFIGALCRPGINELLEGTALIDEFHVERVSGVMGPKFVAAKIRPRRYDACLLLTNSFSTALTVRIAGVPRRVGYDRDGRGILLTQRLRAEKKGALAYAIVPACAYYYRAAEQLLGMEASRGLPDGAMMELKATAADVEAGEGVLARAGLSERSRARRYAVLNPGANDEAKRWPLERFGAIARHLMSAHGLHVLVNGSPKEQELCAAVVREGGGVVGNGSEQVRCVSLAACGITLGALKHVLAGARVMVTNDTGPRHMAAALGVPLVSLFGPTDYRWATIPTRPGAPEKLLLADPTLPEDLVANEHPERCAMGHIELATVVRAVDGALGGA